MVQFYMIVIAASLAAEPTSPSCRVLFVCSRRGLQLPRGDRATHARALAVRMLAPTGVRSLSGACAPHRTTAQSAAHTRTTA